MLQSLSKNLILRGAAAIVVGLIAVVWPSITIGAFVILFAAYAFAEAIQQGATAFSSEKAGPVAGHLLLGILDIAVGVVALAWPGITALVLLLWVAAWAVVTGGVEIGMAFASDESAGTRTAWATAGVISVLFGLALFARPTLGALSLAVAFGVFAMAFGISHVVLGARVRRTDEVAGAALGHAA
ncbi:MAG: DUF308 domain-containing protein [Acidimicrobiia bacterium]|nr:DUF308 domain-containing protein [Acidimicrobiia bacterium]